MCAASMLAEREGDVGSSWSLFDDIRWEVDRNDDRNQRTVSSEKMEKGIQILRRRLGQEDFYSFLFRNNGTVAAGLWGRLGDYHKRRWIRSRVG